MSSSRVDPHGPTPGVSACAHSEGSRGDERDYDHLRERQWAEKTDNWRALLGLAKLPRWIPWHLWFAFALHFLSWERSSVTRDVSDYALQVRLRELLALREPLTKRVITRGSPNRLWHEGPYP